MASQKSEHEKTPENPKAPRKEELTGGELDKVVGGLKKNPGIGGPRGGGIISDPCSGGE